MFAIQTPITNYIQVFHIVSGNIKNALGSCLESTNKLLIDKKKNHTLPYPVVNNVKNCDTSHCCFSCLKVTAEQFGEDIVIVNILCWLGFSNIPQIRNTGKRKPQLKSEISI